MSHLPERDASAAETDEPAATRIDPVVRELAQSFQDVKADARQVEQAMHLAYGQTYQGPVPSPLQVREFNAESPGMGNQLVQDYLLQRQHDRRIDEMQSVLVQEESNRAERERKDRVRGFNTTYAFLALLVGVATYFGIQGNLALAALFFGPPLLSLAMVTIQQLFSSQRNRK